VRAEQLRVVVAGTAGGVGTTTVTALLFHALVTSARPAPQLLDHTGGTLGARLPDGAEVTQLDSRWQLHDLGPLAATAGVAALADPTSWLVVVAAATPRGCALAARTLDAVAAAPTGDGLDRTVLVLAAVAGRHRITTQVAALPRPGGREVVRFPADDALAAGGRIVAARFSRGTRQAVRQLVTSLPAGVTTEPPGRAGASRTAALRDGGPAA